MLRKWYVAAIITGYLLCLGTTAQQSQVPSQADSDAALDTIALINHINYVVEVIRTYNNVIALEEEYRNISADNLNLNRIPDEESLQLIRDILNTLNGMRMNERLRKRYQKLLTRDLKGAKIESMAKVAEIATQSLCSGVGDVASAAAAGPVAPVVWVKALLTGISSTAVGTVSAMAEYKKAEHALQGQLDDKQFELDTDKLNSLHTMNDNLLAKQWMLIGKYHLDDRLRITGKDVKQLVSCLKDSNRLRCLQRLRPMARKFAVYPTYWHYRAAMSLAADNYEEALDACDEFQKINRGLFRNDQMAANVAMTKVTAMLRLNRLEKDDIRRNLDEICEHNYDAANSGQSLFCASVYLSALDDPKAAEITIEPLMARLSAEAEDDLQDYCDLFTRSAERPEPTPSTADLVQCRMLRLAIDKRKENKIHVERLKEICERATTCSLEKLFYFGQLRIEDLWNLAKKDIAKINLFTEGSRVIVEVPVSWFLLGNMDVSLELLNGAKVLSVLDGNETRRTHVMSRAHYDDHSRDEAYVRISLSVNRDTLSNVEAIRLKLKHVSWPVDIVYAPAGGTTWIPSKLERFIGKEFDREIMKPSKIKKVASLQIQTNQGDVGDLYQLGVRYRKEGKHVEAVKCFRKAAEQGHADAQFNLGVCYANGEGVEIDKAVAMKWYHMAAEHGSAYAQFYLGICYLLGNDVEIDKKEAIKWIRKAAENGYEPAREYLIEIE